MVQAEKKPDFPVAFGKYLLVDLIAVGGMAEVYKAKIFGASGFEKEMVVKRILPRYAANPSFVQMLIDEAKIAVRLTHGNIVPVYELGEFEGTYYIAMEYVQGSTLLDILRKAHEKNIDLPPHFCLYVAAEICAGLSYAFRQRGDDGAPLGLVHRDINPRNIVVTPSGEVKILDFGIARASTKKHQTKSGVIKGTPGYMSPEQMQGFSVDHRSDQFCVAILAHELLTLSRLFPAWTVQEMRDLYERGPIPPPSTMNAKCPSHIDDVIMRALKPRPAERFDDAGDFEVALREAIIRTGTAVTAGSLAKLLDTLEQGPSAMEAPPTVMAHTPNPVLLPELSPNVKSTPTPPTEPMARPPTQPAGSHTGTGHPGFIISLAKDPNDDKPVPLQPIRGTQQGDGEAKDTQVLAKNAGVEWDANIGSDAALIALAKATGAAPGQTRRMLLAGGLTLGVAGLGLFAWKSSAIIAATQRAIAGKKTRQGAMILKSRPSGALVIVDGVEKGKTNLKLVNINPDVEHIVEIIPESGKKKVLTVLPKDFISKGGMPLYEYMRNFLEEDEDENANEDASGKDASDVAAADGGVNAAPVPKKAVPKKKVPKKGRRRRKGRKRRRRK